MPFSERRLLRTARVRLTPPRLLFARLRLHRDRLVLAGWPLRGCCRQEIPFTATEAVSWQSLTPATNLTAHRTAGQHLAVRDGAADQPTFATDEQRAPDEPSVDNPDVVPNVQVAPLRRGGLAPST